MKRYILEAFLDGKRIDDECNAWTKNETKRSVALWNRVNKQLFNIYSKSVREVEVVDDLHKLTIVVICECGSVYRYEYALREGWEEESISNRFDDELAYFITDESFSEEESITRYVKILSDLKIFDGEGKVIDAYSGATFAAFDDIITLHTSNDTRCDISSMLVELLPLHILSDKITLVLKVLNDSIGLDYAFHDVPDNLHNNSELEAYVYHHIILCGRITKGGVEKRGVFFFDTAGMDTFESNDIFDRSFGIKVKTALTYDTADSVKWSIEQPRINDIKGIEYLIPGNTHHLTENQLACFDYKNGKFSLARPVEIPVSIGSWCIEKREFCHDERHALNPQLNYWIYSDYCTFCHDDEWIRKIADFYHAVMNSGSWSYDLVNEMISMVDVNVRKALDKADFFYGCYDREKDVFKKECNHGLPDAGLKYRFELKEDEWRAVLHKDEEKTMEMIISFADGQSRFLMPYEQYWIKRQTYTISPMFSYVLTENGSDRFIRADCCDEELEIMLCDPNGRQECRMKRTGAWIGELGLREVVFHKMDRKHQKMIKNKKFIIDPAFDGLNFDRIANNLYQRLNHSLKSD